MKHLLPLVLLAQLSGVAGLDVSDNSGYGYARPTISGTAGAEYVAPHWEASLSGSYSAARKQELESGHAFGACASVLGKPWGMLLIGVCLGYTYTASPSWSKDSWHPCVVGGVDLRPWRLTVRHSFVGTDVVNEATTNTVDIRYALTHAYGEARIGIHAERSTFQESYHPWKTFTRGTWGISLSETF